MILVLRTDKPETYIGLYRVEGKKVDDRVWISGRELSEQLLRKIADIFEANSSEIGKISGVVIYSGPGSYTGLRIGFSVANSLGLSYQIPVIAVNGENWIKDGLQKASKQKEFYPVSPFYGGDVFITKPKK